MSKMSFPRVFVFTALSQSFGRILSQRLQQTISQRFVRQLFDCDQRFVHQLLNLIERIAISADSSCCREIETAGKDRQSPEQRAFLLREQFVTPVDRGAERLMPATASSQKPETVRKAVPNFSGSQRFDPGRCEFNGERE